jgi:hypothetical protein
MFPGIVCLQAVTYMEGKLLRYRLKLKYGTHQQGWGGENSLYLGKRWENKFDFSKPWGLPDWKGISLWPYIYIYIYSLNHKVKYL